MTTTPLTVLAQNLLETAVSVASSVAVNAAAPLSRLSDRDRGLQFATSTAGQVDLDVDFGSSLPVSGWALINHSVAGVTVTLYGDNVSPPTTVRDTVGLTGADVLRTFGSLTRRYWRLRIPALAGPPGIGEFLLGAVRTFSAQSWGSTEDDQGNVIRDESPAGYVWKTQKGVSRRRIGATWVTLSETDWAALTGAYDDALQGAKPFAMIDDAGTIRWVEIVETSLRRTRKFKNANAVQATFLEVL